MVKSADVMRDRHLDQMVMCCIYVLAKVTDRVFCNRPFNYHYDVMEGKWRH